MPRRLNRSWRSPRSWASCKREPRGSHRQNRALQAVLDAADSAGRAAHALPPDAGGFAPVRDWLSKQPAATLHEARRWLHVVAERAPSLLLTRTVGGEIGANVIVRASALASQATRDVAMWSGYADCPARRDSGTRPLEELLAHVFTDWPVPRWLHNAMLRPGTSLRMAGDDDETPVPIMPHVGQGGSWRTAPWPASIAAHMSRAFAHRVATSTLATPRYAVRTAQALSRGVDGERAKLIAGELTHHRFGSCAAEACRMRFLDFVAREPIDIRELPLVVHWLQHHSERDPTVSFRGRTARSLLALVNDDVRRDVALAHKLRLLPPSGIDGGTFLSDQARRLRVFEIASGVSLVDEGRRRRHCVRGYIDKVMSGDCAIFSMEDPDHPRPDVGVTVEVALSTQRIVQVKGYENRGPTAEELDVLARWAAMRGLSWPEVRER